MKMQINFICRKNSDSYLIKIQFNFYSEKISDLYLMKIQTSFQSRKFSDMFFVFFINVFSNLLQILKFKGELNLKCVNKLLNDKLNT